MLAALRAMSANVSIPALTAAITKGDIGAAVKAVKAVSFPAHLQGLAKTIEQTFVAAARETMEPFVAVDPTFTKKNPLAQAAADWSGQKITLITDETRTAVRKLIRKGLTEGIEPKRLAKEIKPLIGLNARQAIAVQNARAAWEKSGLDAASIDKHAARYTEKLRKKRALMIARTETIGSSNRGQLHAWRGAAKAGLLDPAITRRVWIATEGARTCDYCKKLNGTEIPFPSEGFDNTNPKAALKKIQHPPLHPHCRCTVGLRIDKSKSRLPATFGQPTTPPLLAPPPVVLPPSQLADQLASDKWAAMWAKEAEEKAAAQAAYLAAKLAEKKLKAAAAQKAYRARKKAAAAAQAQQPTPQGDVLRYDEFTKADELLNPSSDPNERSAAKIKIMETLSKRLKDSDAVTTVKHYDYTQGQYVSKTQALRDMSEQERADWVSDRIGGWAGTSGDSQPDAVAMQLAIREEFNLMKADIGHFGAMGDAAQVFLDNKQAYKAFAREMHRYTQEWFQAKGVTHVTLVRGANYFNTPHKTGWGNINLQPASSFAAGDKMIPGSGYGRSSGVQTSMSFGHTMHIVRVPVEKVLGTARTGFGCLNEHEYVLLGGDIRGFTMPDTGNFEQAIISAIKKGNP